MYRPFLPSRTKSTTNFLHRYQCSNERDKTTNILISIAAVMDDSYVGDKEGVIADMEEVGMVDGEY